MPAWCPPVSRSKDRQLSVVAVVVVVIVVAAAAAIVVVVAVGFHFESVPPWQQRRDRVELLAQVVRTDSTQQGGVVVLVLVQLQQLLHVAVA